MLSAQRVIVINQHICVRFGGTSLQSPTALRFSLGMSSISYPINSLPSDERSGHQTKLQTSQLIHTTSSASLAQYFVQNSRCLHVCRTGVFQQKLVRSD